MRELGYPSLKQTHWGERRHTRVLNKGLSVVESYSWQQGGARLEAGGQEGGQTVLQWAEWVCSWQRGKRGET